MKTTTAAKLEDPTRPSAEKGPAELAISFFAGLVLAGGLVLSGMTQPEKVIAFLDIKEMFVGAAFPGQWNYTLGLALAAALAVSLLAFSLTPFASRHPWFAPDFVWQRRAGVDGRLIAGAILFGVGWGLSGYCPGPALANLFTGQIDTVVFVLAMLPGMWVARKI